MEIKEIQDKKIWESFLLQCENKTFLDSWNWGEFQKKEGNKIWRLGIYNNNLVGAALVVFIKARRGSFLFVPHGPILKEQKTENNERILKEFVSYITKIAKEEKADFLRISPICQRIKENSDIFKTLGFREAPIHMHPEVTWELDISKSEEDLLKGMRKTTRYLIRQAEKNENIKIIQSQNKSDLKKFYDIYNETVKRHNFTPFSIKYLENQFESFISSNEIIILLGEYNKEIIASAVIVFWQGRAFYHHGASLSKYNNNKAPVSYLMQWQAIKEAKNRGCSLYNFWGIAEEIKDEASASKSQHPWAGLSLFKMGFGGYRKEYVKTQDMPLGKKYYITYFIEKVRKIKRRL